MEVLLTIYSGEKEYFSREISLPCVIGRGKQSDVAIVHPLVSRRHCEFFEENGVVMARDLGSLNGTFYKGARIGRGIKLPFGDVVSIGRLILRVDKVPGADPQPEDFLLSGGANAAPSDVPSDEKRGTIDVVDVESLLSAPPVESASTGGDSSVIDLDAYLKR